MTAEQHFDAVIYGFGAPLVLVVLAIALLCWWDRRDNFRPSILNVIAKRQAAERRRNQTQPPETEPMSAPAPDPSDDNAPLLTRRERRVWIVAMVNKMTIGEKISTDNMSRLRGLAKLEQMEQMVADALAKYLTR